MSDETAEQLQIRLEREAEFQNSRTSGERQVHEESRQKFYYLADSARAHYRKRVDFLTRDARLLIAGCADGGVTPAIKNGAKYVLGVDIAEEPIRLLAESIEEEGMTKRAEAIVGNVEDLPEVESGTFDLISCTGVLHHLNIEAAMQEWSRILTSNGSVLMLEPMAYSPIVAIYRLLTPSMRSADEHPLKPGDIKLLRKYFDEVKVRGYVLTSIFSLIWAYTPNIFNLRQKSCHFLEAVDRGLTRLLPFLRYLCWTSVIELKGPKKAAG